jgi:hypothetical protein
VLLASGLAAMVVRLGAVGAAALWLVPCGAVGGELRSAVRAGLEHGAAQVDGGVAAIPVTFATLCDVDGPDEGCVLRALGEVAGEKVWLDTGSATLAFCRAPSAELARGAPYTVGGQPVGQCNLYGDFSFGWVGPASVGTLTYGEGATLGPDAQWTVMQYSGGVSGYCGAAGNASRGVAAGTYIGGLMGLGGSGGNSVFEQSLINYTAWAQPDCFSADPPCSCPYQASALAPSVLDTVQRQAKAPLQDRMWAMRWNGELGQGSGSLLFGAAAAQEAAAKVMLFEQSTFTGDGDVRRTWEFYTSKYYMYVVNQYVNGQATSGQGGYMTIFDSGNPWLDLPWAVALLMAARPEGEEAVVALEMLGRNEFVNLTLAFPASINALVRTMVNDAGSNASRDARDALGREYGIKFVQGNFDVPGGSCWKSTAALAPFALGLPLLRWVQQITFNVGAKYLQFEPRAVPVTLPYPAIKTTD